MPKSLDFKHSQAKRSLWQRLDWRKALAIDLGSNEIRIFQTARSSRDQAETLIIDQACVAVKKSRFRKKVQILAVGKDALEMRGRLGVGVQVVFPIVAGRIVDAYLAKVLLKELLKRVLKIDKRLPFVMSPIVMVTVRASTSEFSRRSLTRLFYDLGASEVYLLAEPLAAAIGIGVPVADASGALLMQLGAGVIEAAAISLGSIVSFESSLWSGVATGWELDEFIRAFLIKEHHLVISLEASEVLKKRLVLDDKSTIKIKVSGKDLISQKAKTLMLDNADFMPLLSILAEDYLAMIERLFKKIPNELLSDVLDRGLLLSGNFAKLGSLDQYLTKNLKIPVALVDDPDLAAAKGALTVLENLDLFKESLAYV